MREIAVESCKCGFDCLGRCLCLRVGKFLQPLLPVFESEGLPEDNGRR